MINTTRQHVFVSLGSFSLSTFGDTLISLRDHIDKLIKKHGDDIQYEIDHDYEYDGSVEHSYLYIYTYRDETDEEMHARIQRETANEEKLKEQEAVSVAKLEANERAQLARLQLKYGEV